MISVIVGMVWVVYLHILILVFHTPDSKIHEAHMGSTWGRQDPGGPHVGPMNLAIRDDRLNGYRLTTVEMFCSASCCLMASVHSVAMWSVHQNSTGFLHAKCDWHHYVMTWQRLPRYWPFGVGVWVCVWVSVCVCVCGGGGGGELTSDRWIPLTKRPVAVALMFSLMLAKTNCWTNSRTAGDLRHHDAHESSLKWESVCEETGFFDNVIIWHSPLRWGFFEQTFMGHYDDVIMSTLASKITSLKVVYSTIYSGADQSKHQSSASLAFVWGIHRGPVNSPHKWPVTRKMFPFDDVIMRILQCVCQDFKIYFHFMRVLKHYIGEISEIWIKTQQDEFWNNNLHCNSPLFVYISI